MSFEEVAASHRERNQVTTPSAPSAWVRIPNINRNDIRYNNCLLVPAPIPPKHEGQWVWNSFSKQGAWYKGADRDH